MAKMFNAVLPENIGRGRNWDRGPNPAVRLPQATIDKLRADLAQQIGTTDKYYAARERRVAKTSQYKYPGRGKGGGVRFLSEEEQLEWFNRVNATRAAKIGTICRMPRGRK